MKGIKKAWAAIVCAARGYHKISIYNETCRDCGYERSKKND